MGVNRLHIIYGAVSFVLLVLMVIGFGYCGRYRGKTQNLVQLLNDKTAEYGRLADELDKTQKELAARSTQVEKLKEALSVLRKEIRAVADEKAKVEQEEGL